MRSQARIGILGGTFDPPHFGHLALAKKAIRKLDLDKVIFVPAGLPPLKKKTFASSQERLKMVKLLLGKEKKMEVSEFEIKEGEKGKISYALQTIKHFKKKYPRAKIFWLIGEDSFEEILEGKWKGGKKILDEVQFVVAARPGYHFKKENFPEAKKVFWLKLNLPISATEIREKIKKGEKIEGLTTQEIIDYLRKKKIYGRSF